MKKYIIAIITSLVIISCTSNPFIGGGSAVDLEAPVVEIKEPNNLAFINGPFIIKGTATDNFKVTKVVVRIEKNRQKIIEKTASMTGRTWFLPIDTLPDGEYSITATAYDEAGNNSRFSYQSIVVTIDASPSELEIKSPSMRTKEQLEAFDYRKFEDLYYFQNQTFKISGVVKENFKPDSVAIWFVDEEGEILLKKEFNTESVFEEGSSLTGSMFNWTLTIDSETDMGVKAASGERTYFDLRVEVKDKAGNVASGSKGHICVYQEADKPWFVFSSIKSGNDISIPEVVASSNITGNMYDDDGLKKVSYEIKRSDGTVYLDKITEDLTDAPKADSFTFRAPNDPGVYTAVVELIDINGLEASYEKEFSVPDRAAPYVAIDSLGKYETEVASNKFTVKGTAFDNVEPIKACIAWVPRGVTTADLKANKWTTTDGWKNGIRYWPLTLGTKQATIPSDNFEGFKKSWQKEFNVTTDFKLENGTIEYDDKYLFVYIEDEVGKFFVGQTVLYGDKVSPTLDITAPEDNATVRNVGAERFTITGTVTDAVGVASLKVTNGIVTLDANRSGNNWSIESSAFTSLAGGNQNFDIVATDFFNNTAKQRRTLFVDNDNANVVSVTSYSDGNKMYNSGSIDIVVRYNKIVTVTGTPRLKLNSGDSVRLIRVI